MNDNGPSNELNKGSHPDNNSSIGGAESQGSNLVDENKTSVKKVLDNGGQIEEEQLEYVDKVLNNGVDSPLGDEIIDLKDPIINGNQKTEKSEFIIQDLNEIRNLKLSDINIEKFFYNILKKDIDNPNTFIDIFKKIINDELISKTEMELIGDVWTSEFYKNLLHNVVYKGNRNLIKKLIPALHDQINKLLREFSIKKVKSSIDGIISQENNINNDLITIEGKDYFKIKGRHYELVLDYEDYKIVKELGKNDENGNILINSNGDIILSGKEAIGKPFKIGDEYYCKWKNNNLLGLSNISGKSEKMILFGKEKLSEPIVIGNNVYFIWSTKQGFGLSSIIGNQDNILLFSKEYISGVELIGNKILCEWKNGNINGISDVSDNKDNILISGERVLSKPTLINDKILVKSLNDDGHSLSDISGNEERILLQGKKWIGELSEKGGKIHCKYKNKLLNFKLNFNY